MKQILVTSRRWDEETETIKEHTLTIEVSDKTAESIVEDLVNRRTSAFSSNYMEGQDFEFMIKDAESGEVNYHAVRM